MPMRRIAARMALSLIGRPLLRAPGKTKRPRAVRGSSSRKEPQKFKQLYVSKVSSTEVFKNPNRFPDFGRKARRSKSSSN
jgi:hypothetical protein